MSDEDENHNVKLDKNLHRLSPPQQLFLQRILASHVLTNDQAQSILEEISNMPGYENMGNNLKHTLSIINKSISSGFGLEVRSVSLALSRDDHDNDSSDEDEEKIVEPTIYHAIVNKEIDGVAKEFAHPVTSKSPHEMALFRLILERLLESFTQSQQDIDETNQDNCDDENEDFEKQRLAKKRQTQRGMGCQASLSRMEMINLRTELTSHHKDKLSISQVEMALANFESQGWLVSASPEISHSTRARRESNMSQSSAKKRRRSMNQFGDSNYLQIGPRTYMELPDVLTGMGLDPDAAPQFLLAG